ncbi:hypothetical protein RND71_009728 [Anisodus tanguticus]|uniref:Uncharacterized protein n=1 Tax=Anisodus tanguticus TaxID=243964 RepID=A0AAE1VHH0_9SOLA|nr:hypothetical protein RND71_009728 [Anisodus tanguticus]
MAGSTPTSSIEYNGPNDGITPCRSRSIEDKPTYLGKGPDINIERSSQAEAEKKAYDYVGVK